MEKDDGPNRQRAEHPEGQRPPPRMAAQKEARSGHEQAESGHERRMAHGDRRPLLHPPAGDGEGTSPCGQPDQDDSRYPREQGWESEAARLGAGEELAPIPNQRDAGSGREEPEQSPDDVPEGPPGEERIQGAEPVGKGDVPARMLARRRVLLASALPLSLRLGLRLGSGSAQGRRRQRRLLPSDLRVPERKRQRDVDHPDFLRILHAASRVSR